MKEAKRGYSIYPKMAIGMKRNGAVVDTDSPTENQERLGEMVTLRLGSSPILSVVTSG